MKPHARYTVRTAELPAEVALAQRLRYQIFDLAQGAAANTEALDRDAFDSPATHLLLSTAEDGVVGTCRLITCESLRAASRDARAFYSSTEFDLSAVPIHILEAGVELGRLAVGRKHRRGSAFMALWSAIGQHMQQHQKRYLFGCVSIAGTDSAAALRMLSALGAAGARHAQVRVAPHPNEPTIADTDVSEYTPELPPLLRLYLAAGARICSAPAVDPAFGVCDVWTFLDTEAMQSSYRARFFQGRR